MEGELSPIIDIDKQITQVMSDILQQKESRINFSELINLLQQNDRSQRLKAIREVWAEDTKQDRTLREKYAKIFIWVLVVQLVVMCCLSY